MGYTRAEIFAYEHELNRVSYWRMEKGCNMTLASLMRILDIHQLGCMNFPRISSRKKWEGPDRIKPQGRRKYRAGRKEVLKTSSKDDKKIP